MTHEEADEPTGSHTSGKAVASLVLGLASLCVPLVLAIPSMLLGVLALMDIGRSRVKRRTTGLTGTGLAVAGITVSVASLGEWLVISAALLLPTIQQVQEGNRRVQSQKRLQQLALAMHAYNDDFGQLPPAVVYDRNGRPLYSWRVVLLPYLGEAGLYEQFKLDEPWDGPHNRPLLSRMPAVYAPPGRQPGEPYATYYQVVDGPGAMFESDLGHSGGRPLRWHVDLGLREGNVTVRLPSGVPDGSEYTLLITEGPEPVPWTKPRDIAFRPGQPLVLGSELFARGFDAAFADASVRFLDKQAPSGVLEALVTRAGGEVVTFPDYKPGWRR